MKTQLQFRDAQESDIPLILHFIKELAEYEKMSDDVIATQELLHEWIFEKKIAKVFFAVLDDKEIGFALYFYNFSTFVGRAGIYLEDLYVLPQYRKNGYGRQIFNRLAKIAVDEGCGRMEWSCLNWNKPSIGFYLSLGAKPMKDWTVYRLTRDTLQTLADQA